MSNRNSKMLSRITVTPFQLTIVQWNLGIPPRRHKKIFNRTATNFSIITLCEDRVEFRESFSSAVRFPNSRSKA